MKLTSILDSLPDCDSLVHKTIEVSISVMKTTGREGQDIIKQEIEQLNNDWDGLQYICKDTEKTLKKCIEAWEDYLKKYNVLKKWIEEYHVKVDEEKTEDKKTPEDLENCKLLLNGIVAKKQEMENLNDCCESLMEQSACSWIRDQTVQLQGSYTNLLTKAQGLVLKIEKNLSNHGEFLQAKEKLEKWLQSTHGVVQGCLGEGDETNLKDKLDRITIVSAQIPEGQVLLTILQDSFTKAISLVPAKIQEIMRDDMNNMRSSYEQLTIDVTSLQAQVKAAISRWEDFNESKKRLEKWLSDTENILENPTKTKGELSEIKTSLEFYKNLQSEISNKQVELNSLQKEAEVLGLWAKQYTPVESIKQLQLRHEKLATTCAKFKGLLEVEMQEYNVYHQSLQDTEKWLLQVSFHLMAHNSLYITNREQTEEQIAQHELLLNDIQRYQATLDDVKSKGHGQIERYSSSSAVKEAIEKQLNNVQESYNSLLHTAIEIKNRLLDSLTKFKEYEAAIESICQNLDKYEPIVDEEIEKPVNNLKEAREILDTARVSLN